MTTRALAALGLFVAVVATTSRAHATGFTDIGQDIELHDSTDVEIHGALRVRGELLYNLDLDHGLTPSGQPLFPVPLSDPTSQTLTHADGRVRTDVAAYTLGAVAVKLRIDMLDDYALGSTPDGIPSATTTQVPSREPIRIERAYGEVLTPLGLLAAGRMGNTFGLGMLTNGGDCADCDSGDAADRVAFITPLVGHIFAVAYDLSGTGPLTGRRQRPRTIDLDPADDVRGVTGAFLRYHDDLALARRRAAGKTTVDYGAYVAHRWQTRDVPASYLPLARPVGIDAAQSMHRGFTATAVDGWLRITLPRGRIELEAAGIFAHVEQTSLVPGALLRDSATSTQFGAALESDFGRREDRFSAGLDAGIASGDPAPGFGALYGPLDAAPRPGDLDGPQASIPRDTRVDNFRFHPDYRIDRILFREIVGTVTDAWYVRPHARLDLLRVGRGTLSAQLAGIVSFAIEAASTPGGEAPLGVELDPTLVYASGDGFLVSAEHAVLFPLAGFDNRATGASPRPAQLFRVRLGYAF